MAARSTIPCSDLTARDLLQRPRRMGSAILSLVLKVIPVLVATAIWGGKPGDAFFLMAAATFGFSVGVVLGLTFGGRVGARLHAHFRGRHVAAPGPPRGATTRLFRGVGSSTSAACRGTAWSPGRRDPRRDRAWDPRVMWRTGHGSCGKTIFQTPQGGTLSRTFTEVSSVWMT